MKATITATAKYLPQKILSNQELEKMVDTSNEWILSRTGIENRHIVSDGEATSDMCSQIAKQLKICWLKAQEALGQMTTVLQESITGIQATKSFNAETYEHAKFESTTAAVYQHSLKASLVHSSNGAFFTFIFSSITGIVLFLGIHLINIDQTISPGQLAQFIFYLGLLAPSVRMAGWIISSL